MHEFIRSLNTEQKAGLVDLIENRSRAIPIVAEIIKNHLKGDSTDYEEIFGKDETKGSKSHTVKASPIVSASPEQVMKAINGLKPKNSKSGASPSVSDAIKTFAKNNIKQSKNES